MTDGRINKDVDLLKERVRSGKNLCKRGKNNMSQAYTLFWADVYYPKKLKQNQNVLEEF